MFEIQSNIVQMKFKELDSLYIWWGQALDQSNLLYHLFVKNNKLQM